MFPPSLLVTPEQLWQSSIATKSEIFVLVKFVFRSVCNKWQSLIITFTLKIAEKEKYII